MKEKTVMSSPMFYLPKHKLFPLFVLSCIGIYLSIYLLISIQNFEKEKIAFNLKIETTNRVLALQEKIDKNINIIKFIASAFSVSGQVERSEFQKFTEAFLQFEIDIQALEWAPYVLDSERQAFEALTRQEGFPDFQITERKEQGVMVPARKRDEYFPINYLEPFKGNEQALGFDLVSNPLQVATLNNARDNGEIKASQGITLVQEVGKQYSFIVYMPVYKKGMLVDSVETRRKSLQGFVLGVFRIGDLVEDAFSILAPGDLDLYIYDESQPNPDEQSLYNHKSRNQPENYLPTKDKKNIIQGLYYSMPVRVADRRWQVFSVPTPGFFAARKTWNVFVVPGAVLFLTVFFVSYLLTIYSQVEKSKRQAQSLFETNDKLELEISERKQAEDLLKQNQYYLSKAQELGLIGTWDLDILQNKLLWTDENCRIFGVPEGAVVNFEIFLEKIHSEDREYVLQEWNAALEGKPYDIEHRIVVDGKTKWVREKANLELDEKGRPQKAIGFTQDITDRKETEKKLKDSGEKLREIFEQSGGYCLILDPTSSDGIPVIIDVNKEACLAHGYTREEMLGRPVAEMDDEEGNRLCKKRTIEIMKGQPFYCENKHIRKDGTSFWVAVNAKRIDIGDNPPIIFTMEVDITSRKRAEENNLRLITCIDQASEIIFITNLEGNIEYVNPAFERITGYSKEEAIGKKPSILKSEKQDNLFYSELWATIVRGDVWQGHFINKKKDGSLYDEEATITPVENDSGEIINFVAIKREVTEEIRIQEQLSQAQKMESIGTLAGGIAHDFNNILGVIMGCTELSIDEVEDKPNTLQSLQQVLGAAYRAKDLVSQILLFSRSSKIEMRAIKVIPIVNETCKFLRSSLPTTIEIRQNITARHDLIIGDPTQFHQIFMNLCTNAGHAMKKEGGKLEVLLEEVFIQNDDLIMYPDLKVGSYLKLIVKDSGYGISQDNLNRIFEPYFTTKGKGEGTGLGLAVVHGIVKGFGGDIRVYSELGKGTAIHVLFPLIKEVKIKNDLERTESLPTGTETILFVDDEEFLVRIAKKRFERLGYTVVEATSGADALETFSLAKDSYDLVITDKTMPKMTGFDLAERIKKIRSDIPILLCTSVDDKEDDAKMKRAGIAEIIMKPLDKRVMAEMVRKVLDNKEL